VKPGGGGRRFAIAGLALSLATATAYGFTSRMDGPWGMIPGGPFVTREPDRPCNELSGVQVSAQDEIEVEVHSADPRTITTWNVLLDGTLYLPADFLTPIKRWPRQVLADPLVRVRSEAKVYRCWAIRVTDEQRIEALRRAIAAKYEIDPDGWASRATVWWFELRPVDEFSSASSQDLVFVDFLDADRVRRELGAAVPTRQFRGFGQPRVGDRAVDDRVVVVEALEDRIPQIAPTGLPPLWARILEIDRQSDHV